MTYIENLVFFMTHLYFVRIYKKKKDDIIKKLHIEDASLSQVLLDNSWGQPLVAARIGLIPNYISSVLLTDLY